MNVLLINHYAGSRAHGMEYRPYYLAREWQRLGHKVTIVAASCSHVRTLQPKMCGQRGEENIDGVRYVWLKTPRYAGNGLGRAANILYFVTQLCFRTNELIRQFAPNAVIASSTYPLDNWPAHQIARLSGATHVYEVHDLWPLSLIELGSMQRWHPFVLLMQWAENYAYRSSQRVVSLLPNARAHMREHGMLPEKFFFVPNGINADEWDCKRPELPLVTQNLLNRARSGGRLVVGYAGAHGVANHLEALVEAAALLPQEKVSFLLVGQGPEKSGVERLAEEYRLKNIYFAPQVDRAAIPTLIESFDIAYIGLKPSPIFRFGISPNKLMDYMMGRRVVIQAIDAGNDIVRESGCGVSVGSGTPTEIAGAVRYLASLSKGERDAMGQRGRDYVLRHHDYRVLAQNFLAGLERVGPQRASELQGVRSL